MRALFRSPGFCVALLAVLLALGFLGVRGIWDPDEGRYTNVALNMLHSGDWLNPRRNDEVGHWTKPPLTYWLIASSVAVFGSNPWAARLPAALSYLFCVWLAWRIGRRLVPGSEYVAALIYATMLFPVGASQLITTDYVLAACETLAVWAFVEARFGDRRRPKRWISLMWAAFALAFLTKGPPGLLPLLVVLAFDQAMPERATHRVFRISGVLLFALLALPWYVAVIHGNPGLFEYFIGDEVVNRVTTNEFGRHGEWYGWLQVYVPTLLIGTLPWTGALLRGSRGVPAAVARWWRDARARQAEAPQLFLTLWLLLPLLVFCVSRSRLPLYLLPLFVPLALLAALQREREGRPPPRWRWLALWVALLLGLQLASAWWPTHKNAAQWADAIRQRAPGEVREVVFVEDMARYGLHLHMGVDTEIEKISQDPRREPRFNPEYDEPLAVELAEAETDLVWVCKQDYWPELRRRIAAHGYRAIALGTPYQQRVIFRVEPLNASAPAK
ncbi:glycosyltransferase family 39 protein [Luteimonas sp. SX5]|uniref:Glycosyltransferase family 39 protein n=1 Tax=Luteimonas galliterrae TaxID=2940486 RepID=A0ABT0MMI7_9GAMM|nr:glycosyltransferase family 39 protein [Luteimonas galliterrae]MCL1636102.1 glycosyltransferase family 39 protein [Luteimonas galliterrae]